MSLHDAFGQARRARCVNEKGGVVRTPVDPRAFGGTICNHRINVDDRQARTGDLLRLCEASIDGQEDGGFGVIEKLRDARGRVLSIEDDHDAPAFSAASMAIKIRRSCGIRIATRSPTRPPDSTMRWARRLAASFSSA